jgi:hypothetical protein
MAVGVPPKKNVAFTFFVALTSQADVKLIQANPTLAAGDVKVSIGGAALANITTLPVVTPAGARSVQVDLSASEMNADNVIVIFADAAGAEWCDLMISINTSTQQVSELALTTDLTGTLADSIPADGTRPSMQQALLMITRYLFERSLSGTTLTVKKEDGSTTSMTFTINDASNPTSQSRTT